MKRRLPYPYHFNFGTSRTQEHIKPRLITSLWKSSTIYHQTKERAAEREQTPYKQMKR